MTVFAADLPSRARSRTQPRLLTRITSDAFRMADRRGSGMVLESHVARRSEGKCGQTGETTTNAHTVLSLRKAGDVIA